VLYGVLFGRFSDIKSTVFLRRLTCCLLRREIERSFAYNWMKLFKNPSSGQRFFE